MKQNYLQKYFFYDSLIVMAVQLWLLRRPSTSKITPKILALTKGCDDEHLIKYRFQECLFLSVYKFFLAEKVNKNLYTKSQFQELTDLTYHDIFRVLRLDAA